MSIFRKSQYTLTLAVVLGILTGWLGFFWLDQLAAFVGEVFINFLKLISLPLIFFSIVSTTAGMENVQEIQRLGKKVAKYTLLTTIIAAFLALSLYLLIDPVRTDLADGIVDSSLPQGTYIDYFKQIIPANAFHPFIENNVMGVLFLALLLSIAMISLPPEKKSPLQAFFQSFYSVIMVITKGIIVVMPIGIWAFIALFVKDLQHGLEIKSLALYLTCILSANLIQALVILPLFLKAKGISPLKTMKAMFPALSVAFFTKSSSGALPMAMKCAEENAKISPKVARFSFPLCTTINMNGCAAFILTTVLFVSMSNGVQYSLPEMVLWVFVSTLAAIGNAGVPMGCYFLSGALLASMNVPLNILGVILPFYALIDMLESAINVWSDSCVAAMVDKEVGQEEALLAEEVAID